MSKYVVLDLEMCRVPRGAKRENFQAPRELIQIGAVLLDEQYKVADTFMSFVKPQYGWVDDYIKRLQYEILEVNELLVDAGAACGGLHA